jgi:hypothetical protein
VKSGKVVGIRNGMCKLEAKLESSFGCESGALVGFELVRSKKSQIFLNCRCASETRGISRKYRNQLKILF